MPVADHRLPAHRAADGAETVAHVDVAVAALGLAHVEARAVVAHLEEQAAGLLPDPDLHVRLAARACRRSAAPRGSRSRSRPRRRRRSGRCPRCRASRRAGCAWRPRAAPRRDRCRPAAAGRSRGRARAAPGSSLGRRAGARRASRPPAAGSSATTSLASRRLTASATRCCWAPSCRLRSTRRRSASPLATTRARDARSSSAWRRSSSIELCSAVSSCALCRARPTWRARSASTRSSSSRKVTPPSPRLITMMPSSSPPWLIGATRSGPGGTVRDDRRHPHRGPRVARDAGARDDRALVGRHVDRALAHVGHRDHEVQDLAVAGVDLGRGQRQRLAQRLDQLQQQLVHGDGARQAAAEGAHDLVGRLARAVGEAGGVAREARAQAQLGDRGDRRGGHRPPQHVARGVGRGRLGEDPQGEEVGPGDRPRRCPAWSAGARGPDRRATRR